MAVFMYNKDGATLFNDGEKIPDGFVDCPSKVKDIKEVKKPAPKAKEVKKDK